MIRRAVRLTRIAAGGLLLAARAVAQGTDSTAILRGVVYDNLISLGPLQGAEVWIEGTNHMARTDAAGRFELSALAAGRYTLTVYHPILDSAGLSVSPVVVDVAAGAAAAVNLATPTPAAAHHMLCPHDPGNNTGVILGLVLDAASGKPLPDVTVTAHWTMYDIGEEQVHGVPREVAARSDASGRVLLCSVPTDVQLVVQGQAGAGAVGMLLLDLAGRAFDRADLYLAATPVTGTITGVVRNQNGSLLAGASVGAVGTEAHTVANELGGFTLRDVTAGSRIVEARAIGYPLTRAQATIHPGRTQLMDIVMGDSIPILEPVTVEAPYEPYLARIGFNQRRNTAEGYFLDTADVHRSGAVRFEEVFRMVPGVRLRPNGTSLMVELQRGEGQILNSSLANYCPPAYFIDGVHFPLPPLQTPSVPVVPGEILAIEVYANLFSAPPQYQRRDSACGVILVWTKRGIPNRRPSH